MDIQAPIVNDIASGRGWRARNIACRAKVGEPAFEELHQHHVIAIVKSGMFNYHGKKGRALLHSGALLVGNVGHCYSCGHNHNNGDDCLAIQFDDTLYAEVASSSAGSMAFEFRSPQVPIQREVFAAVVVLETALKQSNRMLQDQAVLQYLETVLQNASQSASPKTASHRCSRKIENVIGLIEERIAENFSLQDLADITDLSRYHFLRVFKQEVGMTPHQFILLTRIRRAVVLLTTTKLPIIEVGLASGFSDLSTFNKTFKAHTGKTPRMLRQ